MTKVAAESPDHLALLVAHRFDLLAGAPLHFSSSVEQTCIFILWVVSAMGSVHLSERLILFGVSATATRDAICFLLLSLRSTCISSAIDRRVSVCWLQEQLRQYCP